MPEAGDCALCSRDARGYGPYTALCAGDLGGGLCSVEVVEVLEALEALEAMRHVLLCMLECVEGWPSFGGFEISIVTVLLLNDRGSAWHGRKNASKKGGRTSLEL